MCLENFCPPTEKERSQTHIGYKIVKKIPDKSLTFESEYYKGIYTIGKEVISNRDKVQIEDEEVNTNSINTGIHFYINQEIKNYLFEKEDIYTLIEIEINGLDLVAFGEGPRPRPCPCRCPCPYRSPCRCLYPYRCLCPYRSQATAIKVKVLREITKK